MCDCIARIERELKEPIEKQFGSEKYPVIHHNLRKTASGRASITIYVDLKNRAKPKETFIVADFCPWCGAKYV